MEKKPLKWSKKADIDLDRIAEFYGSEVSPVFSEEALRSIYKAGGSISRSPYGYRAGKKAGTREYVMSRFPFTIVYRVKSSSVEIIRVLHQASRYFN